MDFRLTLLFFATFIMAHPHPLKAQQSSNNRICCRPPAKENGNASSQSISAEISIDSNYVPEKYSINHQVIDYAFFLERSYSYRSIPDKLYNEILHDSCAKHNLFFDERKIALEEEIYPHSYLYDEAEYRTMRVVKFVDFKKNNHLSSSIIPMTGELVSDEFWHVHQGGNKIPSNSFQDQYSLEFNPPNFKNLQEFDSLNVAGIIADTFRYHHEWEQLKWHRERFLHLGFTIDRKMRLSNYDYTPPNFEILSFEALISNLINSSEPMLTGFNNSHFQSILSNADVRSLFVKKGTPNIIHGVRFTEDYFLNLRTGQLDSRIIAFGIVGQDKTPGKELVWFWYPEFPVVMKHKGTKIGNRLVNYEKVFDEHLYEAELEEVSPMGKDWENYDSEWLVELQCQVYLALIEESQELTDDPNGKIHVKVNGIPSAEITLKNGVYDGPIRFLYPNGYVAISGNMVNGFCEGPFNFFYQYGDIKAQRNFKRGKVHGIQKNYWPNGKLYAEYEETDGLPTALTRWYDDGTKLEQGEFLNGIPNGIWHYQVKCPSDLLSILIAHNIHDLEGFSTDGLFKISGKYTQSRGPNCKGRWRCFDAKTGVN